MQSATQTARVSERKPWAGLIVSAIPVLFLLVDSMMKVVKASVSVQGTIQLGYPESVVMPLGLVLLVATIVYAIPQTAVLGAILLTGYLGGAVATHVRVGDPLFTHVLFPVYLGVFVWGGLFLRNGHVRALLPLRQN